MVITDLFLDVLRTLWAHKLRAALTMFGIAWGIVSIVLMVAAGEGLRVGQAKVSATLGRDVMIIFAGTTSMQAGGARAGRRVRWEDTDVPILQQEATDCEHVLPELGQGGVRITSAFNSGAFEITGSTPPLEDVRSTEVGSGRFYNWDDYRQVRKVAFLGTEVKKQLFASRDPIGATVMINDRPFTVIGVMKQKDQDSSYDGFDVNKIFVPYTVMQQEFPNKPPDTMHTLDRLLVTPRSVAQHEQCKREIAKVLGRIHRFDPKDKEALHNWDTLEEAQAFQRMTDGMKYFLGAVGLTTLFLGGLGVMNVMLVAVRERTREIGVRKAVGAAAGEIRRQFFLETLLLVSVSGAVGLGIAYGLCALVDMMPMPQYFAGLIPTWQSGALSVGLLGTIAILSAMYPANKAATIDPIEALRYEAGG